MMYTCHHSDPRAKADSGAGAFLISHDDGFLTVVTLDDPAWDYFIWKLYRESLELFNAAFTNVEMPQPIRARAFKAAKIKHITINGYPKG